MTISGMAPPPCLPPWKWPPDWSRQAITSAAAAWSSGFHEWHLQRLSPAANPCHSRQPQYPQTQTPPLAAAPQTRPLPLHSHPRLVAQSDRDLVQYPQPTSAGSGQLPQRPTLCRNIDDFLAAYNQTAHPFEWKKQVVFQKHPKIIR